MGNAMALVIECCGRRYELDDRLDRHEFQCRYCGTTVTVRKAGAVVAAQPTEVALAPSAASVTAVPRPVRRAFRELPVHTEPPGTIRAMLQRGMATNWLVKLYLAAVVLGAIWSSVQLHRLPDPAQLSRASATA